MNTAFRISARTMSQRSIMTSFRSTTIPQVRPMAAVSMHTMRPIAIPTAAAISIMGGTCTEVEGVSSSTGLDSESATTADEDSKMSNIRRKPGR